MTIDLIRINDIYDKRLDIFARLNEAQLAHINEPKPGIFIAESPLVAGRALDQGYRPISVLIDETDLEAPSGSDIMNVLSRCENVPVFTAPKQVLLQITGFQLTRGLLVAMERTPLPAISDVIKNKTRIVVLEDVVNPTNIGAIFRSAAALNVEAVLLTSPCSDPLSRRAARVAMGNVFLIPWTFIPKESNWMATLKDLGFKTAAMALSDNSIKINDPCLKQEPKLALILGSEGPGLKEETINASDYVVKIPMAEGVDSLNVAAASAVAFWELTRESD